MGENNFYHGPIFPEMRRFVRDQFHVGDIIENFRFGFRRTQSQRVQKSSYPGKIQTFFSSIRDGSDTIG